MLTDDQVALVRYSWVKVVPLRDTAGQLFYRRLFEIAPEVEPLFRGDIKAQSRKLMDTLNAAIQHLDELDELVESVRAMGRRHAGYGVTDEMYASVAEALLYTLDLALGPAFTPEMREAT